VADQEGHPNCIGHGLFVGGDGVCTEEVKDSYIVTCEREQAHYAWSQRGSLGDSHGAVRKHYRPPLVFICSFALFFQLGQDS